MCGLFVRAGETRLRARWATRQPRKTWLRVALGWGVVVKVRWIGGREVSGLDERDGRRSGVKGMKK